MNTPSPPTWPHCAHGADAATDPVGCRGIHVPGHTTCLAHLTDTDRNIYLTSLTAGARVDLRGTTFTESLLHDVQTALHNPATGTVRFGDVRFDSATFKGDAAFTSATFGGDAAFTSATFEGNVGFSSATFERDAGFNSTTFKGDAAFTSATFEGDAAFSFTTFGGDAAFTSATFEGNVGFSSATFERDAGFNF
ncbi:pentapeptide repeat-containing protein, partial [Streptomyces bacillaris]